MLIVRLGLGLTLDARVQGSGPGSSQGLRVLYLVFSAPAAPAQEAQPPSMPLPARRAGHASLPLPSPSLTQHSHPPSPELRVRVRAFAFSDRAVILTRLSPQPSPPPIPTCPPISNPPLISCRQAFFQRSRSRSPKSPLKPAAFASRLVPLAFCPRSRC